MWKQNGVNHNDNKSNMEIGKLFDKKAQFSSDYIKFNYMEYDFGLQNYQNENFWSLYRDLDHRGGQKVWLIIIMQT